MKRFAKTFVGVIAAIVVMMGMLAGFAPAATAEEAAPPVPSCVDVNPDNTESGICADTKSSEAHSSTVDKDVAAVGTNGKILTRYAVAAGMKLKASEKTGCTTVSKPSQIPSGENCIWGKRGFHFVNSGYTTNNVFTTWSDYVGSPGSSTPSATKMKFVKRAGQWYKVGTPTGAGNCANKVWFHGTPKLTWRQVINIKSFANWIFKGSVAVKASAVAEALSKSWCSQNGTLALALAHAYGDSNSAASASYKLRGLIQIRQWTNAKEAELRQSLKLFVSAQAEARAKANASADAYTEVHCEGTPPPPTFESPTVSVVAKACVEEGQSQDVTINVHNPNDDAATLHTIFNGTTLADRPIDANATVTITVPNQPVGPFSGSVLLVEFGKSASFSGEVKKCVTPPPNLLEVETVNDVLVKNTRTITVTGTVAAGHTATLFASAKNGGTITAGKTQTVSGTFTTQVTYLAPSEVPLANGDIAAAHDRVDFTLTQDDGQKNEISTNQFEIKPAPIDPP